jgi:hypothetical protein
MTRLATALRSRLAASRVARLALAALALGTATAALAEHFDSALSEPQLELKFKRMREAREIDLTRPQPWVYTFSGPDSAKVEALSVRLVHDGFRIVSLHNLDGAAVLKVERREVHNPGTLERRNRELAKLAALVGVPRYDGADVSPGG